MAATVADSLLKIATESQALLAEGLARMDSLAQAVKDSKITEPLGVELAKTPPRDFFDYLQAWSAPIAALAAAWLGAWIGGKQSRKGALEAIAQEHEIERGYSVERLRKRIRLGFKQVREIGERVSNHSSLDPFPAEVSERLEIVWNLFYHAAAHVFLIGPTDLVESLEKFFGTTHSIAEDIKALESKGRDRAARGPVDGDFAVEMQDARLTLEQSIRDLVAEVEALERRFEAAQPKAA